MPRNPGIAYWVDQPGAPYRPLAMDVAPTQLSPPTSVVGQRATSTTAELTWAPPSTLGGQVVTGYRVSRDGFDTAGIGAWSTVVAATARSFVFGALRAEPYVLSVSVIAGTLESIPVSVQVPANTDIVAPVLTLTYEA